MKRIVMTENSDDSNKSTTVETSSSKLSASESLGSEEAAGTKSEGIVYWPTELHQSSFLSIKQESCILCWCYIYLNHFLAKIQIRKNINVIDILFSHDICLPD